MPDRETLTSVGLLLMRLAAGGMLFGAHGLSKILRFSELSERFSDPLGVGPTASLVLAVLAEGPCAILVALGAATRVMAIPIVILLVVAAVLVHAGDPWAKKEFALVYAIPFVTLILTGPGRYSVDHFVAGARSKRKRSER